MDTAINKFGADLRGGQAPSEITYRMLFERFNDGIFISRDSVVMDANSRALMMFGYERKALPGKDLSTLSPSYQPDGSASTERISELIRKLVSGEPQRFQWFFLRADGSQFLADVSISVIPFKDGDMIMFALRDVTQEKIATELSEHMFRISPVPVMLTDLEEGRLIDVNESFTAVFGYKREETIGKMSFDIGLWSDPDERRRYHDLVVREGRIKDYELLSWNKKGEQIPLLLNSCLIQYGERKALMTMAQDVTMLRQNSVSLNVIFENSLFGLMLAAPDTGRIIDTNEQFSRITGYRKDELIGRTAAEFGELPDDVFKQLVSLLETNESFDKRELQYARKDRSRITVLLYSRIIRFGGRRAVLTVLHDITAQKQAELAMRELEEKFSKLFSASQNFILLTDIETGLIFEANDGLKDLIGCSHEERIGKTAFDLGLWADLNDRARFVADVRAKGERLDYSTKFQNKNGNVFDVTISSKAIDFGGKKCMINVIRDMSEKAGMEEQLRHARQLENIAKMAGAVADDFNKILACVLEHIENAMSILGDKNPAGNRLGNALDLVNKATSLSHSLLAFSRRQSPDKKVASVRDFILKSEQSLKRLAGADIEMTLDLKADAALRMDNIKLEQILTGMVVNARDAMPEGGKLTIATQSSGTDEGDSIPRRDDKPETCICITISDTGPGISEESIVRMSEPGFFSDEGPKKSSGCGLSSACGIIRRHGGGISVQSSPGHGSSFRISLPVIQSGALKRRLNGNGCPARNPEIILLAKNDDMVRNLDKHFLEKNGYFVYEARDGDEALQVFIDNADTIDLVILDMLMPKKNGKEIFDAVKLISPSMHVVFVCGYTDDYVRIRKEIGEGIEVLLKPVSPKALLDKVGEALGRRHDGDHG
jgi:PAS domain S-box-containing protein